LIVSVDLIIFKAKVIEFHTTKIHSRTWSRDHDNQPGGTNYCLNAHLPLIQVELHHVNPWLVSTSTCHLFCPWSPTRENIHYRFRSTFLMDYWFNSEREVDVSPTLSLSLSLSLSKMTRHYHHRYVRPGFLTTKRVGKSAVWKTWL
jgi:hypothetical protein